MNTKRMKTATAAAVLVGLLVAGVQASNVVGYIKTEVPAGLSLMSVPFETVGGGVPTLDSVFGDKLADSSQVVMFVSGGGYEVFTYIAEENPEDSGWFKGRDLAGTTPLPRGAGFWVRNSSEAVDLVLRGQVPTADQAVSLDPGLQIISFGFPVEADLGTVEGLTPADTDQIIAFVPGEGFVTYTYVEEETPEDTGWFKGRDKVTLVLNPGQAYWYRRGGSATVWSQQKNFTL